VDYDSLLVHLLSLLALASMSFIYDAHYERLTDQEPQNMGFIYDKHFCLSGCEISAGFALHGNLNCSKPDHILLC